MLMRFEFWFYCLLRTSRQPAPQRRGTCIPRSKRISPCRRSPATLFAPTVRLPFLCSSSQTAPGRLPALARTPGHLFLAPRGRPGCCACLPCVRCNVCCVCARTTINLGDSARSACCARQSGPPDDWRRPAKVRLLRSLPRPGDHLAALWATCLAWATSLCLGIGPVVRSTLWQHGATSSQSRACVGSHRVTLQHRSVRKNAP
jgi:hypothetical protein